VKDFPVFNSLLNHNDLIDPNGDRMLVNVTAVVMGFFYVEDSSLLFHELMWLETVLLLTRLLLALVFS
jgi:hypothetical protein